MLLQEDKAGEGNSDDEYASAMLVDPEQGFMGEFSIIIFINTISFLKTHSPLAWAQGSRRRVRCSHVGFLIIQSGWI